LTDKVKLYWVYGISIAFIALNIVLILNEFYWSLLLPLVVVVLLMYIFALDKLLLLITFLTPLAVVLRNMDVGLGVSLPTEPLMFGVLVIFFLKIFSGFRYDKKALTHPISIAIFISLSWLLISTFTSEMLIVSIKFFLSRLWFVVPFFFVGIILFKKFDNIKKFIWLYVISLVGVIFYTLINHSQYGFDEETGHWVMTPFYNDHTAYGAVLAMFIPVILGFSINKNSTKSHRIIAFSVFVLLIVAVIFSYSRAAWVSLVFALGVFILIRLKVKFSWIAAAFVILVIMFFSFQHQIIDTLERNEQDSSTDFVEHIKSIYNISSDASNLERINRWQAAIRMFNERPFLGWGPGTYQFLYAPFQRSKEKTIISTNAGDLGNAHSEYIGPMAEQGVLGLITVLLIIIYSVITALKIYKKSVDQEVRLISMLMLMGLITYFVHGLLNNFLDTDKASVPVWGFLAIIVALDIYHTRDAKEDKEAIETKELPEISK
jgi:O-antigen ligase